MRAQGGWAALAGLALVLAALGRAAADVLVADAPPNEPTLATYWPDRIINVCTAETVPIIYCSGREPDDFDGYEVVLFRRVASLMGWPEAQLNWTCWDDYDAMLGHLAAGDGVCDVSPAGIGITPTTLADGYTFTLPTLSAGYSVMVATSQNTVDYWVFMESFEWSLWVALVLTCVGVGVVLWLLEPWTKPQRRRPSRGDYRAEDLQELVWRTLGRPMQTQDMVGRSLATNLVIVIFAFMMLIMVAVYTANTSANLTASLTQTRITGYQDLPGKRVATWDDPEYLGDLARRGIQATGLPWDTVEDQDTMFEVVRNGTFDALVLDSYVLDFGAAATCDLATVGGVFQLYYGAVAFPAGFNDSGLLAAFNEILVGIQKSGDMEALFNQYISPPPPACKTVGVQQTTQQVSFAQVAGLWMVLGAAVAIATAIVIVSHLMVKGAKKVADTEAFRSFRHSSAERLRRISTSAGSALRPRHRGSAAPSAGTGASGELGGASSAGGLSLALSGGDTALEAGWSVDGAQGQAGATSVGAGPGQSSGTLELPSLASGSAGGGSLSGDGSPGGSGGGQAQDALPPATRQLRWSASTAPGAAAQPALPAVPHHVPPHHVPPHHVPPPAQPWSEAQLSAPASVRDVAVAVHHMERLLHLHSHALAWQRQQAAPPRPAAVPQEQQQQVAQALAPPPQPPAPPE